MTLGERIPPQSDAAAERTTDTVILADAAAGGGRDPTVDCEHAVKGVGVGEGGSRTGTAEFPAWDTRGEELPVAGSRMFNA